LPDAGVRADEAENLHDGALGLISLLADGGQIGDVLTADKATLRKGSLARRPISTPPRPKCFRCWTAPCGFCWAQRSFVSSKVIPERATRAPPCARPGLRGRCRTARGLHSAVAPVRLLPATRKGPPREASVEEMSIT